MPTSEEFYDQLLDRAYGASPPCDCNDGGVPYAGKDLQYWVQVHVMAQQFQAHRRYFLATTALTVGATALVWAARYISDVGWNTMMWVLVVASVLELTLMAMFLMMRRGFMGAIDRRAKTVRSIARSRVVP